MVDVGIVILNWNGHEDTIECLQSVKTSNLKGFKLKVVVIDNASSDNSVARIRNQVSRIRSVDIKIIKNDENLGFAGGNNVGINYLLKKKVNHILILNNDTLVDVNFISELLKYSDKKSNYGVLSPKIYFAKGFEYHKDKYDKSELGRVIWAAGGYMDWENVFGKNRGVDEVDNGQYDRSNEIDFATGAAMLLNAKLLKKVGLFDERFFMYFEDADLVTRSIKSGYKNYYVPKSIVWHKVARSSGIGSDLNDYFITRNRLLFGSIYAPARSRTALYKESLRFLFTGRRWQKRGVKDYYSKRFGKGSWKDDR